MWWHMGADARKENRTGAISVQQILSLAVPGSNRCNLEPTHRRHDSPAVGRSLGLNPELVNTAVFARDAKRSDALACP